VDLGPNVSMAGLCPWREAVNYDWKDLREDLAICECGGEFLAKIKMISFGEFLTDRDCPMCGRRDRVYKVVWNTWWARLMHWFGI
jgi:hypothetical protein